MGSNTQAQNYGSNLCRFLEDAHLYPTSFHEIVNQHSNIFTPEMKLYIQNRTQLLLQRAEEHDKSCNQYNPYFPAYFNYKANNWPGRYATYKEYTIQGKIVDRKYEQGIPGLKVEAWDKDLICDDFLDHRETDEQGRFRMEFSRAQFQEWFLDRKADLFFKIYHNDEEIHSTRVNILWNYDYADKEIIIPIDWEFGERYLISGYVRTEDNRPVPNFKVIAFDRKVGEDRSLGESMTKNGIYQIDYTEKATELLQNQYADLFVQGYNSDGKVIARSDLVVNAPKNVRINLTVPNETYRAPSEFEELNTAIKSLVELDPDVKKDFEDKDIEYIAAKLKLAPPKVERFIHAWKLVWAAGEYKEGHNIPAEVFYGITNDNDLPELESIVNQNKKTLKQSLEQAVSSNAIPIKLKDQIDNFVDALKEIAVAINIPPRLITGGLLKSLPHLVKRIWP